MNKFEKFLQEHFGEHEPREIEELVFDNFWVDKASFTIEEKKALEKYVNLIHLSLNNIGLKSLENLPSIKSLYYLSLKNNELSGDDFDKIKTLYPKLNKLKISGNVIEKMDNLMKLKPLKLRKIEVKENPFSVGNDKYIKKVFDMLPTLKIVDQTDKNGDEEETTDYHNEEKENEGDEDGEYDEEEEAEDKNKDNEEEEEESEEKDSDNDNSSK
jgi:hypothetical protein